MLRGEWLQRNAVSNDAYWELAKPSSNSLVLSAGQPRMDHVIPVCLIYMSYGEH